MAIAVVPLVVLVVGLLMWALASNPKIAEAGKIMFFCGVLILTMSMAKTTLSLG
jgi:Na+/phosphate symporter